MPTKRQALSLIQKLKLPQVALVRVGSPNEHLSKHLLLLKKLEVLPILVVGDSAKDYTQRIKEAHDWSTVTSNGQPLVSLYDHQIDIESLRKYLSRNYIPIIPSVHIIDNQYVNVSTRELIVALCQKLLISSFTISKVFIMHSHGGVVDSRNGANEHFGLVNLSQYTDKDWDDIVKIKETRGIVFRRY